MEDTPTILVNFLHVVVTTGRSRETVSLERRERQVFTMRNNTAVRTFSLRFGVMALTNKALVLGHAKFGLETDDNYTHKLQYDTEVNNHKHGDDAKRLI